jgi:hypothetical protein
MLLKRTRARVRVKNRPVDSSLSNSSSRLPCGTAPTHYHPPFEELIPPWKAGCDTLSKFRSEGLVFGRVKGMYHFSRTMLMLTFLVNRLNVAVHYLPKFYLQPEALIWPEISIMDAKRFGTCTPKWKTSNARLLSSAGPFPPGKEPELSISIPKTAQAVSNQCFIANVTLRVPGATSAQLDDYVSKTIIQLVKVETMSANGSKSAHIVGLSKSKPQQIEKELVGPDTRIIRGGFRGGVPGGEASWNVGQLVMVEYFVRVTVTLDAKKGPIFRHDEPIQMFSHSNDQFESPFEVHDAPAYNLLLGSSLSNNTASLR